MNTTPFIATLLNGKTVCYHGHPRAVETYTYHEPTRIVVSQCDEELHVWRYEEEPIQGEHRGECITSGRNVSGQWEGYDLTEDGRWLIGDRCEDSGNNYITNFAFYCLDDLDKLDFGYPTFADSSLHCGFIGYPETDAFLFDGNFYGEEHCVSGPERILRLNPDVEPGEVAAYHLEPAPEQYAELFEEGFANPRKEAHPNPEESGIYFASEIGLCDLYKHGHLGVVDSSIG